MTRVSLVLATIGRTVEVGRLIESLLAQTDKAFELVVVDQNLDDRLAPYLSNARRGGLEVHHERVAKPGLANARNLGIAIAKYPWVGFPDDDCWYEPDLISHLRNALDCTPSPGGIVANWVEQSSNRKGAPADQLSLAQWRRFRGGDASSISLFFQRQLLRDLGGFDARFGVGQWFGAAEETDFILRALAAGTVIIRCPAAQVHHRFTTGSTAGLLVTGQGARKRARGTGGIYAKHRFKPWIVLRGIAAPVILPLLRGHVSGAVTGCFVALGRLEGLVTWKHRADS